MRDIADMPVQVPANPKDAAARRARFFNSGNAFNIKLPPVPAATFFAPTGAATTGFFPCDQSNAFDCAFPATTPLMLARYVTIEPRATLASDFAATGAIWYVIAGHGSSRVGGEHVTWARGDVFLLPGGVVTHEAAERALLWVVTNEPQLAFEGSRPAAQDIAAPVHFPAAEIARQVEAIYNASPNATTSGLALIFASEQFEANRNLLPTLTLSLNTLPPHTHQRAHAHSSAAITLVIQGAACHSMVDGVRAAWSSNATLVTPPTSAHAHYNEGAARALFLIVQDGGLHYHARTMNFTFLE